jgi:ABC-2 type transport system permease protein
MSTLLSLLKFQIDNKTDILKASSPKAMIRSVLKVVLILLLSTYVVGFALSKVLVLGFLITPEFLGIVLLATQVVSLIFATATVINTLYLARDNEMLICLPITPNQLFISKLLVIYLKELAVNALISVPLFLSLGSSANAGICYYLSIPILLLLIPIFPIVIAAFISMPLMGIIRFLQKHTLLAIVVAFSLIAGLLFLYLTFIGSIASEFKIASEQFETVRKINVEISNIGKYIFVYFQLASAMFSFANWYYFAFYLMACAVVSAAAIIFTRHVFFKLAMTSLENTVKAKGKVKKFKKRGIFRSLFQKELFCVFRSFSEVFEYFLFTILMPFIVVSYDKLLMTITVNQAGVNMIAGAHVMVVAIMAMLSNISSASAISRDGGNFHTSKTIPVGFLRQVLVKFSFNAVFTLCGITVTAIISLFIYPAWQVLLGSLAVAMASMGHIAYCIDADVKSPTINLQGNEEASTVSKSTPKSLIFGLAIGFVMGLIVIMMSTLENQLIPYLIIIALSFVFMVYRIYTMILRVNLCYEKIEM